MRDPSFWWRPAGPAATALAPFAMCYGAVARWRLGTAGRSVDIPVICIGNPTVGGSGKTPTAMAVARLLIAAGRRPFFLSRGYGGEIAGPVRVDPGVHRTLDVGDEPILLARVAPTIVSRDRVAGAEAARFAGADVIVMDDGFQNPSLKKDLSILVIDGRSGIGNGKILPAGPLRAPLDAQLDRAQALLVVGQPSGAQTVISAAKSRKLPVFQGRLVPDRETLAAHATRKVLAFAGIGHPEKFFATLDEAGIDVRVQLAYPDHHHYHRLEAMALLARAERDDLMLLTTEKDFVRIASEPDVSALLNVVRALPVTLAVEQEQAFRDLILGVVAGK